jgi:hypothetical protein
MIFTDVTAGSGVTCGPGTVGTVPRYERSPMTRPALILVLAGVLSALVLSPPATIREAGAGWLATHGRPLGTEEVE